MGVRISEIVKAFERTYKCIDIRAAIHEEDDRATVLILVIRLSYEDPVLARARLDLLRSKHDHPSTAHFSILLDVRPFSDWPKLVHELQCGVLSICESYFLMRSIDIGTPEMDIQVNTNEVRPFDGRPWPAVLLRAWPNSQTLLDDRALAREISRIGYSDPYEAVNSVCELNVHKNMSPGQAFNLSVPVFARVASVSIPGDYNSIQVEVEHEHDFPKLEARLLIRQGEFLVREAMKLKRPIEFITPECENSGLSCSVGNAHIAGLQSDDWIEIRLLNSDIGVIVADTRFAYSCVKPIDRNPLWPALKRFCSGERLTSLLAQPYSVKSKKLKESAAFELHVSWLLSCFGFSPIVLGEYEDLLSETHVKRGSVDIIAAQDTNLLIVACTLGVPKEEDFSNLLHVAEILRNETFSDSTTHILPVLFTGATGLGTYKQVGEHELTAIPVIDTGTFQRLLRLLEKVGAERFFLQFLASPALSALPSDGY